MNIKKKEKNHFNFGKNKMEINLNLHIQEAIKVLKRQKWNSQGF